MDRFCVTDGDILAVLVCCVVGFVKQSDVNETCAVGLNCILNCTCEAGNFDCVDMKLVLVCVNICASWEYGGPVVFNAVWWAENNKHEQEYSYK